ncbi:transcriptional repressor [Clostridia bacterium]|nr:transcriptional repressor [Clostridia bacterium]
MKQERFVATLKEKGLKVTKQRLIVLEVLAQNPDSHLTIEEIYTMIKKKYSDFGLATVYRTIQVLLDLNIIGKINLDDRFTRYEIKDIEEEENKGHDHHHSICLECGAVISFKYDLLEKLEQFVEKKLDFVVVNHEVKFYGYCSNCKNGKQKKERGSE